jgi:hypothetical protein
VHSVGVLRTATMTSHIVEYGLSDDELHMGFDNGGEESSPMHPSEVPAVELVAVIEPKVEEKAWMLEEVQDRIRRLAKPPPARDSNYFKNVCGLNGIGDNPHDSKVVKLAVSEGRLKELFGHGRDRSGFRVRDIGEERIRKATQEIWPLYYGKSALPHNKLLGVGLCRGIAAQVVYKMDVNWVAFAAGTNRDQQPKYTQNLERLTNIRDALLEQHNSHLFADRGPHSSQTSGKAEWMVQLLGEVDDLMRLGVLEWATCKQLGQSLWSESKKLAKQYAALRMVMESVEVEVAEESERMDQLTVLEKGSNSISNGL